MSIEVQEYIVRTADSPNTSRLVLIESRMSTYGFNSTLLGFCHIRPAGFGGFVSVR